MVTVKLRMMNIDIYDTYDAYQIALEYYFVP